MISTSQRILNGQNSGRVVASPRPASAVSRCRTASSAQLRSTGITSEASFQSQRSVVVSAAEDANQFDVDVAQPPAEPSELGPRDDDVRILVDVVAADYDCCDCNV